MDNAHAYRIYEALGFVAVRRLVVWFVEPTKAQPPPASAAALGCMHDGAIAGAVIYRAVPERVSILGIGAHGASQLPMLDALVDGARSRHAGLPVRLLNLPEGDPAEPVFERLGARAEARQIHMRLTP